ncbi:hypothetical protein RIF29_20587 [Crotalaria pallida]|uniref:Uncharacterized protein n=1 Tax=Crotalaria pallida TaxID=3830 RepID=A0AAN9F2W3_CROPI
MKEAAKSSTHKLPYAMFISHLFKENDISIPYDEEIMEPRSSSHCLNENLLHLAGIYKRAVSGWDVLKRKLMGHIDSRFDAFQTAYRTDLAESRRQICEELHAGFASVRAQVQQSQPSSNPQPGDEFFSDYMD